MTDLQNSNQKIEVYLLWTGGLDSTFRLWQLSLHDISINPIYVVDPKRSSVNAETRAMKKILGMLRNRPSTRANLNDIEFVRYEDIPHDDIITESYIILAKKYQLGSQYEFLARLAKHRNLKLEVGIEGSSRSKANNCLSEEGALEMDHYGKLNEGWASFFKINPNLATKQCRDVFENIILPAELFQTEKTKEVEIMKSGGAFDIAKETWFCHNPVLGMTCGRCNPCKDALNEGMEWRVSTLGRFLGFMRWGIKGVGRKIIR